MEDRHDRHRRRFDRHSGGGGSFGGDYDESLSQELSAFLRRKVLHSHGRVPIRQDGLVRVCDAIREMACTPLCSAISVNAATIVRLFLEDRADPNGYQSREFVHEGEPYKKTTPLLLLLLFIATHCRYALLVSRKAWKIR